jgi:lipid-binding SYLF domain-containing protein
VFSAGSAPMAAHATMDTSVRSGVFYAVRVEGLYAGESLELRCVVGYSPDGKDMSREHYQDSLPGND